MYCELNKPLCKRKLMKKEGPFEKKKSCPLSKSTLPLCPLAAPQCPLLPQDVNNCPINKLIENGNKGQMCPLAQPGCPCDPNPPCPLAYDDDIQINYENSRKSKVSCPAKYPLYSQCPKSIDQNDINQIVSSCPQVLRSKDKKLDKKSLEIDTLSNEDKHNDSSSMTSSSSDIKNGVSEMSRESSESSESTTSTDSNEDTESKKGTSFTIMKKGLTVPDCTLSSSRPFPCSECLGALLAIPEKSSTCKMFSKDCPYLKIINMCEDTCPCDEIPSVDCGPPCPYAPKACPCCAATRCPLTRIPTCPLISRESKKEVKPPPCKCCCPIIPPPCSLNIPPQCAMHNNNNPVTCPLKLPKCTCIQEMPVCPLVPSLYSSCPLQASYQTKESYDLKPKPNLPNNPESSQIPSILVPPNLLVSLDDTLQELNKLCTCDSPPSPQMVNMIPTTFLPKQRSQQLTCITSGEHNSCPLECPCEPPRTFHVPTCPKRNPPCLRSFPESKQEGEMVCPFSSRGCPLGLVCPFPVKAVTDRNNQNEDPKIRAHKENQVRRDTLKSVAENNKIELGAIDALKTLSEKGNKASNKNHNGSKRQSTLKSIAEKIKTEVKVINTLKELTDNNKKEVSISSPVAGELIVSKCPLNKIPSDKKTLCPFAPDPCPLDPIKPLVIEEPKVCPFAPEPLCPLMPKPLCPATPRCLLKPTAPLPECPYAPPGCPLAPKKVCFPETNANYECPCPKPQPCPCPDTNFNCPCPMPKQNCLCLCPEPYPNCPCPELEPKCYCPKIDFRCPSSEPNLVCPCPEPDPKCPCPGLVTSASCPLKSKPKYPLVPLSESKCPVALENSKKNSMKSSVPLTTIKPDIPSKSICACASANISGQCPCPSEDGTNCPCTMLAGKTSCLCKKPAFETANVIDTAIDQLKRTPKELDCPVKIPPCEKFPEGRCPMEDLGLCNCDYPCPPCLEPPLCGTAEAPPQYCVKPKCCMGLPLPPVTSDDWKESKIGKPLSYYKFVPTKPDREETKYHIDILNHPPNDYPFGPPKKRENPNWSIVKYGTAYEKCKDIAEKLKKRKPNADAGVQYNPKDNPMDAETKLVMENRENQARLEREELFQ